MEVALFLFEVLHSFGWEVLNRGFDIPQLWSLFVWSIAQEHIDLLLPIVIFEIVVKMPLD